MEILINLLYNTIVGGDFLDNPMVHLYIGDGKGKTSAAYGLALRASGRKLKVAIIAFLKSPDSGEIELINEISRDNKYISVTTSPKNHNFYFLLSEQEKAEVREEINSLFELSKNLIEQNLCDLIVLDEIIDSVNLGLIKEDEIVRIIKHCTGTEIIMTGRNPSDRLVELADYVSDIHCIKHPYQKGKNARKGIEY